MSIRFTKMHGAGNDYIYINAINQSLINLPQLAVEMSDRHKGVGADGIVLIMKSSIADFRMRMFNADGSEGEMCGNASRCVAKYVYDNNLIAKRKITLETLAGIKTLEISSFENDKVRTVRVDMGEPAFSNEDIPVQSKREVVDLPIGMGNPHGVIMVDDVESVPVDIVGNEIQNNEIFPRKANIEFLEILGRSEMRMRVYERGSGETMACGTGACAAVVAASRLGLSDRSALVHLRGGDLQIEWADDNHVYMIGEAATVFTGEYYSLIY